MSAAIIVMARSRLSPRRNGRTWLSRILSSGLEDPRPMVAASNRHGDEQEYYCHEHTLSDGCARAHWPVQATRQLVVPNGTTRNVHRTAVRIAQFGRWTRAFPKGHYNRSMAAATGSGDASAPSSPPSLKTRDIAEDARHTAREEEEREAALASVTLKLTLPDGKAEELKFPAGDEVIKVKAQIAEKYDLSLDGMVRPINCACGSIVVAFLFQSTKLD